MEEVSAGEPLMDLKYLEIKIGRKIPEVLVKWMREDTGHRWENKFTQEQNDRYPENKTLADKISNLKQEMASLRSVDVRILRQLVALHEGIESVRWLLEERGALASRCSSLASSQYSLADASLRDSWSSLQDGTDRLDTISVGSYLDTLADDADEYCPSVSEPAPSSAPLLGGCAASPADRPQPCTEETQADAQPATDGQDPRSKEPKGVPLGPREPCQARPGNTNFGPERAGWRGANQDATQAGLADRLNKNLSPKSKAPEAYQNGKMDQEECKGNSKVLTECDAHWRWVQSQDDVTFL